MPFGKETVANGTEIDFDAVYNRVLRSGDHTAPTPTATMARFMSTRSRICGWCGPDYVLRDRPPFDIAGQ